jgi:hypothetical protein
MPLVIGSKLKSSSEPSVYVLFESEVPESARDAVLVGLPRAIATQPSWSGRMLSLSTDGGFRYAVRQEFGKEGTKGFDAAFERWIDETNAAHGIRCVINSEGKGTSLAAKQLQREIIDSVLPCFAEQVRSAPASDVNAWFLLALTAPLGKAKLNGPQLTALSRAFEPVCATTDSVLVLGYLLTRYRELTERGAGSDVDPASQGAGFRLALLLDWSPAFTLEAVEALAKEVDEAGAKLVARAAVRRLTSPSSTPVEERAAIAHALAASPVLVERRTATREECIGGGLSEKADTLLFPFMRERTEEDLRSAFLMYEAAIRFRDAPAAALINHLFLVVATGHTKEAVARADAVQERCSELPLLHVSAAAAYAKAGRVGDAVHQLEQARERGVDLVKVCADPVLRVLHETPETTALVN